MKIGFVEDLYPEKRNIINKINGFEYINTKRKLFDIKFIVKKIIFKIKNRDSDWNTNYLYSPLYIPPCDLIHTFNHVYKKNMTNRHWICTIEGVFPRTNLTTTGNWSRMSDWKLDKFTKKCLKYINNNCDQIICMSKSTENMEKSFLNYINQNDSQIINESILDKIIVMHPPQTLLIDDEFEIINKYHCLDCFKFIIVGHDFFRKGGAQLVDKLLDYKKTEHNIKIKLIVVSKLNYGDYASRATFEDYYKYKTILEEEDWIEWYKDLPNDKVINLIKSAHVGYLASLSETYGYSVLEMQACGVPVITTNIRSFPEINNDEVGWICKLPLRKGWDDADIDSEEGLANCKKTLSKELEFVIDNILENKERVIYKAINSWKRIKKDHDPIEYSNKLSSLYNKTINRRLED